MLFDRLQIILWTLAYVFIVFGGKKHANVSPKPCMPLVAGCLNFCWEFNALILSHGMWGHILWLSLDILILYQNMRYLYSRLRIKGVAFYSIGLVLLGVLLAVLFRIPNWDGMLYTAFAIDLILAVEYVVGVKKISPNYKTPIAVCKMLGDLFAWLYYCRSSMYVTVIGLIVLILNMFYLCWCIEEKNQTRKKVKKH